MIAWVNAAIGIALSFLVGMAYLGLSAVQVGNCVLASEIASFVSLISVLQAEQQPWIRRYVLNRSLKTWTLLLVLYAGLSVALAPPLRDFRTLLAMALPLILGTGLAILVFGPIQDRLVRRRQLRTN